MLGSLCRPMTGQRRSRGQQLFGIQIRPKVVLADTSFAFNNEDIFGRESFPFVQPIVDSGLVPANETGESRLRTGSTNRLSERGSDGCLYAHAHKAMCLPVTSQWENAEGNATGLPVERHS